MTTKEIIIQSPYLVVPIDVEAMCIGNESDSDNKFTTDPYQFNLLQHKEIIPLSKHIYKATTAAMEKGIYVHWALPDGLTHAIEKQGKLEFPVVPNRWLVSRLINGDENNLTHWVVESDYLSEENNSALETIQAIPYTLNKRETAVKYLGRVLSIDEWQTGKNITQNNAYEKLTATGYGIPEFAASYQHSKGVFSFYDADIKNKSVDLSVSYFVVGWYECYEKEHPILEKKTEKITELLEHYKWCLPQDTTTENTSINDIYFSGSISGINWNANKKYLNDLPYPEISLAIGHNENEALSALISGLSGDGQQSEHLLNALQLGLLEDVVKPDSVNNFQNLTIKLNDATFQSKEGGTFWQIEPDIESYSEKTDNWKLDPLLNNKDLSQKLNELNKLQKKNDDLQQQLMARKKQLYLYWTASLTPNTSYQTQLRAYLKQQVDILTKKEEEIRKDNEDKSNEINTLKTDIKAYLTKPTGSNYSFVLKQYPSARYYKPLEPVILFQGDKINCPQRYGGDGAFTPGKKLVCRLNHQLVSNVNEIKPIDTVLPTDFNRVPQEIIGDLLLTNPDYLSKKDKKRSVDEYKKIIKDFILPQGEQLEVTSTTTLHDAINQPNKTKEILYQSISQTNRIIDGVQFNNISSSPVGINFWENNPWLPLYFSYDVSYYPVLSKSENMFGSNFITSNFKLEHGSDKLVANKYDMFSQKGIHYQNTCLLSQHSKINLQEKIEEYIRKYPERTELDESLKQFLEQSQQLPDLLSQCLFGLNDALVGLKNTLQLPVVNYDENERLQTLAESIDYFVGDHNSYELDSIDGSVHYYPLSGGLLKINSLTIVDAFGRHIDVPKNQQFRANSLKPKDKAITNLYLAPRFVWPSKLTANWLDNNDDPTNGLLASNPIQGWLMPNFIDESISLFTKEGESAGELTNNGTWKKTPGSTFTDYEVVKNTNIEFKKVLTYLENAGNLRTFLEKVKDNLKNNQPQNHRSFNAQALFFGVPLAIAKIRLSLEIEGLPPIDYNKTSIEAELEKENIDVFNAQNKFNRCLGLDKVEIPLLVGNNNHIGDGLMAYFEGEAYNNCFYENEKQCLTPDGTALNLCVIFDPRNSIHFHTGILPVKELRFPEHYYSGYLQNMQLAIEVPTLVTAAFENDLPIKMPLPHAGDTTWQWWFENNGIWKSIPAQEEQDDAVNEGFNELTNGWLKLTNKK